MSLIIIQGFIRFYAVLKTLYFISVLNYAILYAVSNCDNIQCKSKVLKKNLKLFHVIYNIKSNKMRCTVLESAKRPPCNFRQIFIP